MTDNASSNYSLTHELQSTPQASGIEWPALINHTTWIAHVIQLAVGALMCRLSVKGRTKSWEAHGRDQQSGENECTDVGNSQRLHQEGNARINKVSAMRPGLATIIEKLHISRYVESLDTVAYMAANACWIDNTDTWSSKPVHWLSRSHSANCSTSCHGCEDIVELNTGVT